MSDLVTPLNHARYDGFCSVAEVGPVGMITLRGDHGQLGLAVHTAVGVDLPAQRLVTMAADKGCAWMSPDELLLMLPRAEVPATLARLARDLADIHHLAADVSDARAVLRVTGPLARDLLAKLTPADVSPQGLPVGEMRRTRLAQVAAALRVVEEGEVEIICFRSVARYVFDILAMSARPGSEPGLFPT